MTLQVEYRQLKSIVPYVRNARTHPVHQIQKLKASLAEYGWANPMLIADEQLIAGHGRLTAALEMAIEGIPIPGNPDPWAGPMIDLSHLTPTQRKAYILMDNRSALDSAWDYEILALELGDLHEEIDLSLTGFSDDDLSLILCGVAPGDGLCDPDDVPSVPVTPVSEPGDTWILGSHRLQVGDFSDLNAVDKALNGVKPHLMVTDVYQAPKQMSGRPKFQAASAPDWREAFALFPGDVAYVWHDDLQAANVAQNLTDCGFGIRSQIIWVRPHFMTGRGDYQKQHEPAFYAVKASAKGHWTGGRTQSTIWQFADNTNGQTASKPVECMKRPIENNSSPGQAVYDPCAGKGSVIIACEITGRICHALEADSKLADVALKRFAQFTGKQPVLESTGKTYDDMAAERTPKT